MYKHVFPSNFTCIHVKSSEAMKSSRKLGKHVEDGKGCFDKISSLPDELLGHVLSFLWTRYAVRTSILSKRWRYLFTLTSCLSFNDEPYYGDSRGRNKSKTYRKRGFKKFVNKVLKLHQISPIKKFDLICRDTYDISDLNAWISNAVQKGVQEVHYQVAGDGLPNSLVTCETLVRLNVIGYIEYDVIEIPLSARLLSLKILYLNYIRFVDYDSMQRLFSSFELLEELTLDSCETFETGHVIFSAGLLKALTIEYCSFGDGLFEIDAPNLVYLTYNRNVCVKIVPSWKYPCSLVEVELHFESHVDSRSFKYEHDILRDAASKTTELHLLLSSVELLRMLADHHEQMPDFLSLTRLHLDYVHSDSWKYVTSLLDKSPQLKTVVFEEGLHDCFACIYTMPPPSDSLIPFACHAQVIEVCDHEISVILLEHLLRNARVLKKLIIRLYCGAEAMEEELRISKNLLLLPRASSDCRIELLPSAY